jgi:hypothetical protein
MLPISNNEDDDGLSCVRVPARGLPPSRVFRGFGVLSGSLLAFLLTRRGQTRHAPPSAQAPLPCLSSRLHGLVGWRASACGCRVGGARGKAGGELSSAETPRASLVPTEIAPPLASPMHTYMRWWAMASMAGSFASKPFEVLPAVPRSLPGATPPCTG